MPKLIARKPADVAAMTKAAREDRGITQVELASRLVFSRDYLVDLESSKSNLFATRLFRVMNELGVVVTLEYEVDRAES